MSDSSPVTMPEGDGWIELLLVFPNEVAGGFLGIGLLGTVFVLSFSASLRGGDVLKAYLAACFISFGTAVFLMVFGILPEVALIAVIIGYLLGLALIDR